MTIRNRLVLAAVITSFAAASQPFVVRGQSGPRLYTTWSQPGGSIEGAQYSALKQINKNNVRQLELQSFHPLGVVPSLAAKGITDTGNNYGVHVAFYGSDVDRPGEGNIAWEGGEVGSQGYYVFALGHSK